MVMRGFGFGGEPRRSWAGPSTGGDENAPPGGSSATASRPPLRAIQPRTEPAASSLKPLAHTTSRGPVARAAAATARAPARRSASLAPARSLRKPAPRLGIATTGAASSVEVLLPFKVQEAISFWEENRRNVQNALSTMQQHDSDALEKIGGCSDEGSVRNSEDILSLQIELDMLKTIFVEEVKAAKFHILEACRQKEATEKKLNVSRSKEEYLELLLADEIKKLKEMEKEKNVLLEKRDMETLRLNSELKIHLSNEYLPYEEPKVQYLKCLHIEDSPLSSKLKRMQASLEKAHNLNTRYEQDLASRRSAEHVKDEVCRDVEIALNQVISSLTEQLSSVELQLDSSKKNELLAKKKP